MASRTLTDDQERKLVVDYEDGFTDVQLAQRYGIGLTTVYRTLARLEVPFRDDKRRKRKPWAKPKPRVLKPCGTIAAYKRHKRHNEYPCTACLAANAAYVKDNRK